jgi:hypothetical protein
MSRPQRYAMQRPYGVIRRHLDGSGAFDIIMRDLTVVSAKR